MATSKFKIRKNCESCGREFEAQKRSTRFCSKRCAERAYKQKNRLQTVSDAECENKSMLEQPIKAVRDRPYLKVKEAAMLMGVTTREIYYLISRGQLNAAKLSSRMTLVKREDLDLLLASNPFLFRPGQPRKPITEFYSTKEVLELTGLSNSGLYKIAGQERFPKTLHKGKTMWSKRHIDQWLAKRQPHEDITEWYSAQEIMAKFGMTSLQAVYCFISEHAIPKKKIKREVFYSKTHVDRAKGVAEEPEPTEYTYAEAIARFGMTRDALYHYIKTYNVPTRKEGKYTFIDKAALDAILAPPCIDG